MPIRCKTDTPAPTLLSLLTPTGAGSITAGADNLSPGVEASRIMVAMDVNNNKKFTYRFITVALELGLPYALLAAISSRETRAGTGLDAFGEGDSGNAVGILQIDKRYWTPVDIGPDFGSVGHIRQAMTILRDYRNDAAVAHPEWTPSQQLQAGVAAYNNGPEVFTHPFSQIDINTDGGDYSNDVIARAQWMEANWYLMT